MYVSGYIFYSRNKPPNIYVTDNLATKLGYRFVGSLGFHYNIAILTGQEVSQSQPA